MKLVMLLALSILQAIEVYNVLSHYEDQTKFTVMSYDQDNDFYGDFRDLDWMILAKYYGVNSNFNANDDITIQFNKWYFHS